MKHYQLDEWADYVRGVAPECERITMAAHLSGGCRRCQAVARWLAGLHAIAEADARYRIPEEALERASAIYGRERSGKGRAEAKRRRGRAPSARASRRTTAKKDAAD